MEKNKNAAESRERLLSLQEIDPSPVDESPVDIEKGEYFTSDQPSSPPPRPILTRSSTLGLSGHSTVWWLNRIHRYSSYTFTAFLAAHITNTSLIPLLTRSLPTSDTYLLLTRPYYQSQLLEPALIILPLTLHITSGLALRLYRRRQSAIWYGAETRDDRRKLKWPKLSGTSLLGYLLVPLLAIHTFVNRILPLWVEGGSSGVGLQYLAHGFARAPVVAFVAYTSLVAVGSWHIVWGWGKWLGLTPDTGSVGEDVDMGLRRKRRWYGVNGIAAVLAGLWMAGGLGVVGRGGEMKGWVGRGYDELYRKIPILGNWI
ncbi:hypothetical protein MMC24_002401 [Lignoscripta atroalba]|nr:hypothetical protein [Lignoscripta atroalba]